MSFLSPRKPAAMPQGVKVVNPMMGGDFDAPLEDDDLNESLSPKQGQPSVRESGDAATEVRIAVASSPLTAAVHPLPMVACAR